MPTILVRRGDTSSSRFGVAGVLVVAVLACWSTTTLTLVTADETAPQQFVNVCQATTGNCATECIDSTTAVVRTTDDTVHCIKAYTTSSNTATNTAAEAAPTTSFGAAVAAAAAAVGGVRGSSNQTQTIEEEMETANAGVVDTVAATLAYDGRGIDYYDPVTNIPVTMVWDDIVPCTTNEVGQCHHTDYPLIADEEEEAEAVEEEEEDGADIEADAEADEEETEEDEELTTTTTPTFDPTATSAIIDWAMQNLLDFIGPNAVAGIVQDQAEVDVTTLLNRTLADVVAGIGLGSKVDLEELRRIIDGDVLFLRRPVISISDGDVVTGFTAFVNGLSNLTSHATYATPDNIEGTLIEIGGAASSTGASQYSDGTFSKGYAYSRGSEKKDPETGEKSIEGEALFRGANNFFGNAFTGDTDTKGYATFDGTGMMTEQGGYTQSKGEMIGGLFSFTGDTFSNGTTFFDGGVAVLEGTASADGNLVSNLDGFTSSGSGSSAGFLVLDEFGVGLRGGGYAQFSGSTTSPFFGDFTGDAVSSGTFQRNENGSYTFAGFACLGLPEGCVRFDGLHCPRVFLCRRIDYFLKKKSIQGTQMVKKQTLS